MKKSTIKNLVTVTPYVISAASLIFAAQFLYHTINSSFGSNHFLWIIFPLMASVLVVIGLRTEFQIVRQTKLEANDFRLFPLLKSIAVIITSALITHLIVSIMNTTTIFAASLVCVVFTYVFSNNEAEAYSGTVAGMIGTYLCEHWSVVLLTATVTGFVFILFKPYFKGVGGRGGSIPYVGTTLVVRLLLKVNPTQNLPIKEELIIPSFMLLFFAAFLTYYLHKNKILTVVKSAMILALIFSILIPAPFYTLTSAAFAGTVVGMSTESRIENYNHLLIVVLMSFILFIPSFHILDGIGGKLGILSLLSYYGSVGLKQLPFLLKLKNNNIVNEP